MDHLFDSRHPVVTCEWLQAHLDDPDVVVLEVAFDPLPKAAYSQGHIDGAHFAWWKDLCWHDTDRQFPTPEVMARRLEALGMNDDRTLVLVGDTIQFATYAYWVLTMTGLSHLAVVLDGGRTAWVSDGRPLTQVVPDLVASGPVTPRDPDVGSRLGRDDILAGLDDPNRVLVDMRSDEEYSGERVAPPTAPFDHGAERRGRIPGARHVYYEWLLRPDARFLPASDMASIFDEAGAVEGKDIVTYCRTSHRASLGWFVSTFLMNRPGVRVYDGSWTEWGSIVGFPIEL